MDSPAICSNVRLAVLSGIVGEYLCPSCGHLYYIGDNLVRTRVRYAAPGMYIVERLSAVPVSDWGRKADPVQQDLPFAHWGGVEQAEGYEG